MAKEFKTIDEQVALLESRGIRTDADTPAQLARDGYYAIVNGYKRPFLDTDAMKLSAEDVYLEGTEFRSIYALFRFDRDLRNLSLKYLARAEASMRTAVVYSFCESYPDPNAYLSPSSYACAGEMLFAKGFKGDKGRIHQRNMTKLMEVLNSKAGGHAGRPFVLHYLDKYGFVPLWVLANDLTFGNVAHFYQLQRQSVQNRACKMIAESSKPEGRLTPQKLLRAFSVLVDFRNLCAHDARLYCSKVGRGQDLGFEAMFEALSRILPYEEMESFLNEIVGLFRRYEGDTGRVNPLELWRDMGFERFLEERRKERSASE